MTQAIVVPDALYERLRNAAVGMRRPVEEVAARALSAGLPPDVDDAPASMRDSLRRMEQADDEALWQVWRSRAPESDAARHEALLAKNAERSLTPAERKDLASLRKRADQLMLRRAHAAALLRWRGRAVPLAS